MAKNSIKSVSGKILTPSEHKALTKLSKMHEPMLKEMDKWKDQREKIELALADHLDEITKVLEPFYNQSESQLRKTFISLSNKSKRRVAAAPKRAISKKKTRSKKSK
jgi:hypothetical protein